jgi:guanylate kinase
VSPAQGKLIVISAPSGTGKTTIVKHLLERNRNWVRSVSYTTRAARPGEKHGRDYFFIDVKDFKAKQKKGFFLESANVFGAFYGTSREFVLDVIRLGKNVVLAIDVQGMKQIRKALSGDLPAVSIFIMPPTLEELRIRLEKRKTETQEKLDERLKVARDEIGQKNLYDFEVVNQEIDTAVKKIEEIINEYSN